MNRKTMKCDPLLLASVVFVGSLVAFEKLPNGIELTVEQEKPTDARRVKVQVCASNILRITASPVDTFSTRPSLMIDRADFPTVPWTLKEEGETLVLSTPALSVRIHRHKGTLAFFDASGKPFLEEKRRNGKSFIPATVMGETTYHVRQRFESPQDEAFYGLGQHQNGIMNYKGHDVDLWQHNIVAVVPFLLSSRGYGILWDNNSRTKFGDIREYEHLTAFRLIDREDRPGGFTAIYYADTAFSEVYTSRIEPRIAHEYLDENDPYPDGFHRHVKAVRWTGQIEATQSGRHKLRLYASGYTKMWVDGKLVVNSWRQNWLPWTHYVFLDLEVGQRVPIRIDWIPMGGFIGLRGLPPGEEDSEAKTTLSLFSEVGDQIDYYLLYGPHVDDLIRGYRFLTGRAPMMPRWAMGLWQSRERYKTQDELLDVVREFRKRRIPLDNIVQDWFYWPEDKWGDHDFDPARFPDPKAMVRTLHDSLHTRIMISVWPKFYVGTRHFEAFKEKGWLYLRNVEVGERDWVGPGYHSTFYDPYHPEARALFWRQIHDKLFTKGFDAWWLDATEPDIHSNLSRAETLRRIGPTAFGTAARYLNTYSLMQSRAVYEGQRQADPNRRVFILTRSAFASQQRYASATWSGDIATRWEDLRNQIPAGLNFCLSGIPYWTMDIGGFAVEPRFERPGRPEDLEEWRELNVRWFQFGAFCPIFRVHGQYPYREMFHIAPEGHPAYQAMLAINRFRYRLLPYLYSLAGMVTHEHGTIMRALVFDFRDDPRVLDIADQYLFGPSILVCPVTAFRARSRPVYLPSGTGWFRMTDGRFYRGGQVIETPAPLEVIPLFVREGAILPFGPELQYTDEKPADPIRLVVYTGRDGSFTLYEDEGVNYNDEKGLFSRIPFHYDEKKKTLTIGRRQGSFPGMLQRRTFEVVWVTPQAPKPLSFESPPDRVVVYQGKEIRIKR